MHNQLRRRAAIADEGWSVSDGPPAENLTEIGEIALYGSWHPQKSNISERIVGQAELNYST